MKLAAVILAAGQGTRMKSKLPKVLHPIAGKPMISYAVESVRGLGPEQTVVVVGEGDAAVRQAAGDGLVFVEQRERRGTAHAVLQARQALMGKADAVVVVYADMPLLTTETLRRLVDAHASARATLTMLTVCSDDPMGFGRILRSPKKKIVGIVEQSEATPKQLAIRELNCGVYCFHADWMWEQLPKVKADNSKKEYYLTDLIAAAVKGRRKIESILIESPEQVSGVNTRVHLAQAERIMRVRINERLMLSGVTLRDPATTYVDADVEIGMDTVVEPNTQIRGKTRIGAECRIGPNAVLDNATIGDGCTVFASVIRDSVLDERVDVGPFSDLRPGTRLAREVHVGNFGEVKNSTVGEGTRIGHFSYIGDAELGAHVNIGAGTITCNFDGKKKNRTVIGDDVFIGSDTMLVAPVQIGARARTGAGSVVTKNLPEDSLAVGIPARVIRRLVSPKEDPR